MKIVGVLLSGSILYTNKGLDSIDIDTDWDGIILVEKKSDIVNLINNFRNELCELLEIEHEEFPNLQVPSPEAEDSSNIYNCFDGVRFVGRTSKSIKKGAKILSVEYFKRILEKNRSSRLNILSFKDVRVLLYKANNKNKQYQIQQATRVNENLVILHDMDIFLNECYKKPGTYAAIFGITTDLLMTGVWVYDNGSHLGEQIVSELFFKFCRLHTATGLHQVALPTLFKNHSRFHKAYCENLRKRLIRYATNINGKLPSMTLNLKCDEDPWENHCYYWGRPADAEVLECLVRKTDIFKSPLVVDCRKFCLLRNQQYSPFVSNSQQHGFCKSNDRRLFWKQTKFIEDELAGAELVSQYYCCTQRPEMIDYQNQIIFYPFFNGELLSSMRFKIAEQEFKCNWNADPKLEKKILTLELQRSADILAAFCSSAKILKEIQPTPPIHRFFYDRLVNDSRFKAFYGAGIELPGFGHLTIEELKSKYLVINGYDYGQLSEILLKTEHVLDPKNFYNDLHISGLGDGHGGNLLVESAPQKNSTYKYLYIDYEVAGWHSPMLDLVKPFFIDIFFNLFYADYFTSKNELFRNGIVQVQLADDKSTLEIDVTLPTSLLSNGIYEIKRRYLLLPFLKYVENHSRLQANNCDWPLVFGHALFACATLTRNYSKRPDIFFATLALGVICTHMRSFSENEEVFKMISDMQKMKSNY